MDLICHNSEGHLIKNAYGHLLVLSRKEVYATQVAGSFRQIYDFADFDEFQLRMAPMFVDSL